MKRMIKVLMVAVLMAVILVASISPAMARRSPGGVLLSSPQPCHAIANAQDASGGVWSSTHPVGPRGAGFCCRQVPQITHR